MWSGPYAFMAYPWVENVANPNVLSTNYAGHLQCKDNNLDFICLSQNVRRSWTLCLNNWGLWACDNKQHNMFCLPSINGASDLHPLLMNCLHCILRNRGRNGVETRGSHIRYWDPQSSNWSRAWPNKDNVCFIIAFSFIVLSLKIVSLTNCMHSFT